MVSYTASSKTLVIEAACDFTVASPDIVNIFANKAEAIGITGSATSTRIEADTQDIQTKVDTIDTATAAIKVKTDLLAFTSGNVDSNIVKVAGGGDIEAAGGTLPEYAEP